MGFSEVLKVLEKIPCPPPVEKIAVEEQDEPASKTGGAQGKAAKKKQKNKHKGKKSKKAKSKLEASKPSAAQKPTATAALPERLQQVVLQCVVRSQNQESTGQVYKPGNFRALFDEFVCEQKSHGLSHREAVKAWMGSEIREKYLVNLSESERKKRRF